MKKQRCTWCKCDHYEHEWYIRCPLFDYKWICDTCCQYDSHCDDILWAAMEECGKNIHMNEVERTCEWCKTKRKKRKIYYKRKNPY